MKPWIFKKESGAALITALLMMTILLLLGTVFLSGIIYEQRNAEHWRKSTQAFYLAEAAGHKAVSILREGTIQDFPYTENGVALGNGQYNLEIEISSWQINSESGLSNAYATETYTIKSVGTIDGVNRGVEIGYQRDTFLRFARFVEKTDLTFDSNSAIDGDVLAGEDLNLDGYAVVFEDDVAVGGVINNDYNGIFLGGISQDDTPLNLQMSVSTGYYKNLALGNIPDRGTGIYQENSSTIDFSRFDFSGALPLYNGVELPSDFNGLIYVEGDAYIKGTMEGHPLTVVASDDIIVTDHVRAGNTKKDYTQTENINFNSQEGLEQIQTIPLDDIVTDGSTVVKLRTSGTKWNQMRMELLEDDNVIGETYLVRRPGSPDEQAAAISNLSLEPSLHSYSATIYYKSRGIGSNPTRVRAYTGNPVNIGLVARDNVYIDAGAPKQLIIDAALLSRDGSWHALGDSSSHPDEYDASWKLTINGPIITAVGGSAGPWSSYGGMRKYQYDEDIISYPPPRFPTPFGGCTYWKEIKPKDII